MGEKKARNKRKRDKMVPTPTTASWRTPDNIAAAKEMFAIQSSYEAEILGMAYTVCST